MKAHVFATMEVAQSFLSDKQCSIKTEMEEGGGGWGRLRVGGGGGDSSFFF